MADSQNDEQRELLLTAYFDNELGPEERTQVEAMLAEDPQAAQELQRWRENKNAIRELPKYRLDQGFTQRVLAATNNPGESPNSESNLTRRRVRSVDDSEPNNWRQGLAAIATLAAMLLLTLFVFPAFVGPKTADNQPETKQVEPDEPSTKIEHGTNVDPERKPSLGELKSSLPGGKRNGKAVDPIKLGSFSGPNVEQVFWVDSQSLADLEAILTNHSIKIVDPDSDENHLIPQSSDGLEALYVVSTADRMKQAISEISSQSSCSVKAFPLPGRYVDSEKDQPSVQQIKPFDLTQTNVDVSEIASLDKWFGLVGDEDESRMIQFLLLVSTKSTTDEPSQ